MRKIIFFMLTSIDGYFEGPNHDLSWHNVDKEFNKFAIAQLKETDLLFFGHTTYDMMASFWPSEHAIKTDPVVAGLMNKTKKVVFSKTLKKAAWNNTTILKDVIPSKIFKLKKQKGKYISIFGSSNLALSFIKHGLIDEFRIMVNPLVLGKGTTLFNGINNKLALKLIDTKTFRNGNTLLTYTQEKK